MGDAFRPFRHGAPLQRVSVCGAMRLLVAGATGTVGRFVCGEVVRTLGADALVVGARDLDRGRSLARALGDAVRAVSLDVGDAASIERAVDGVDAVVIAVRQTEHHIQDVCTRLGVHSVDIVPDTPLERAARGGLRSGDAGTHLSGLVAAGLIPGLSGLLAKHALEAAKAIEGSVAPSELHVSLLQRRHGTAGAAGIAEMLGLFSRPVPYRGGHTRGFSVRRFAPFAAPFGDRGVRLVAFPEAEDVQRCFDLDWVGYWTGFDDARFDVVLAALNRVGALAHFRRRGERSPFARLIARRKRAPRRSGAAETVALTAEAGRVIARLRLPSDYGGTAMAAVAMARALVRDGARDEGVRFPFQRFTLPEILALIDRADVELDVTTG